MKEGGASPDGFWAKPSLIGSVRDSEQVQEKALSPSPFPLPQDLCLALFCFVNSWLLICISIHVLFMAFWRKISRDHLAVVCRHKRYSPCVCVCVWTRVPFQSYFCDTASLSCNPKKWMIYATVTPRVLNNHDYTAHYSFSFPTACKGFFFFFFHKTAMLIEWLEKNTDEMFLAHAR